MSEKKPLNDSECSAIPYYKSAFIYIPPKEPTGVENTQEEDDDEEKHCLVFHGEKFKMTVVYREYEDTTKEEYYKTLSAKQLKSVSCTKCNERIAPGYFIVEHDGYCTAEHNLIVWKEHE
jgi:hypothetical protein